MHVIQFVCELCIYRVTVYLFSLPFPTIPSIVLAYLTISEQLALLFVELFYSQDLVAEFYKSTQSPYFYK